MSKKDEFDTFGDIIEGLLRGAGRDALRHEGAYNPRGKTARILDRGYELVQSVPYQVSARWVFYRLLQEGYYNKKSDYKDKWCKVSSDARHGFYKGWRPDTLADETRQAIIRGNGFDTVGEYLEALADQATVSLDKWREQDVYLELWYEARAMSDQFRHYTQHITLAPMGGQPSIPYKWQIAKRLERAGKDYGKPIVILYFGDLDLYGGVISDTAEHDVRKWCNCNFKFIRCGLNDDQVSQYNIPENPEKPGEYQWEALTDDAAREIITQNVEKYLRHDAFFEIEEQEQKATDRLRREIGELAASWGDDDD